MFGINVILNVAKTGYGQKDYRGKFGINVILNVAKTVIEFIVFIVPVWYQCYS